MSLVLDLKKAFELNLDKAGITNIPILETRLAVDVSGSMANLFAAGLVSRAIDLFTVAALKFDDNQSLEVGSFDSTFEFTNEATEESVGRYLKDNPNFFRRGGTNYTPIISEMESKLDFNTKIRGEAVAVPVEPKKGFFASIVAAMSSAPVTEDGSEAPYNFKRKAPHRAYCGILTDGDNYDEAEFLQAMARTSGDTFYQFIGLGNGITEKNLRPVEKKYDHVAFTIVKDPINTTNDQFFEIICNPKFTAWVHQGE